MKTNRSSLQRLLPFQGLRSFAGKQAGLGCTLGGVTLANASRHPAHLGRPCFAAQGWEEDFPHPGMGSA